jgi:hypothetical protein
MPATSLIAETALQRLMMEKAQALAKELESASSSAPHGGVLDACESAVMYLGRQFLRDSLAASLQTHADEVQKKVESCESAAAAGPSGIRVARRRNS